eukprot:1254744-Pleurochrysis_carterae.AAC.1
MLSDGYLYLCVSKVKLDVFCERRIQDKWYIYPSPSRRYCTKYSIQDSGQFHTVCVHVPGQKNMKTA